MPNTGALHISTPTDREIRMTRVFDAPRQLVFDALTKPELVKRWLGLTRGWELEVCEIDLQVGGAFRYLWRRGTSDEVMGLRGAYREVVPPERIVHTELFDVDWTSGETLVTTLLDEQNGKTTLTTTVLYSSREARDGALQSPMDEGVAESYDKLAALLAALLDGADTRVTVIRV